MCSKRGQIKIPPACPPPPAREAPPSCKAQPACKAPAAHAAHTTSCNATVPHKSGPPVSAAKCVPCVTIVDRILYMGLAGICIFGITKLGPDSCLFASTSCAIGLIYGIFGALSSATKPPCLVAGILETFLDFGAIALYNIQVYEKEAPDFSVFHWIFLIPMVLDLFAKLFGDESDDTATQTLKYLCNIANIISLSYISFKADNYMYLVAAILYLFALIGMAFGGRFSENIYTLFTAGFYITAILAFS